MADEDDFITVNITKAETGALLFVFTKAEAAGILDIMPPRENRNFRSFIETMMLAIHTQKLNH